MGKEKRGSGKKRKRDLRSFMSKDNQEIVSKIFISSSISYPYALKLTILLRIVYAYENFITG